MHSVSRIGSSRWTHSLFSKKPLRHPQRGLCDISKISLFSFSSSSSSALRSTRCRIQTTWRHPRAVSSIVQLSTVTQPGPNLEFHVGKIANLTESSVIGTSGQTVALVTMATSSPEIDTNNLDSKGLFKHFLKLKCQRESSSAMVPLTVEYRQRHHAVGKIPTSASRSDNRRLTNAEILASRAIDRALRPLLQSPLESDNDAVHLTCSIQACPIAEDGSAGGHPVSLALNAASVALNNRLKEPVAAVYLCLLQDGTVIEDSSRSFGRDGKNDSNTVVGELLYAGTRENVVMMEFAGKLSESHLTDLITKAHDSIQTRLRIQQSTLSGLASSPLNDDSDDMLKQALGLSSSPANMKRDDSIAKESEEIKSTIDDIFNDAYQYCEKHAGEAALRLFGVAPTKERSEATTVSIYSEEQNGPLLGKALRGRREHLVHEEIHRLLREFIPSNKEIATVFQSLTKDDSSILNILADAIGSRILKKAMQEAAIKYGCRADGRANKIIRPVTAEVPALPDIVHGSALFTRGETQVLCTTTLGPPKDGILINDPYEAASLAGGQDSGDEPYNDLPVGSLRYLRNQEYLESDMNSRKVKASREQTGDSGTLRERRRAFLQYDFPSYSKGEIQTGPGTSASRREIGHGALAEKSILPILPPAGEFPYTIRMTSEVTSSNGSSSMASVCGATLSLLDAGVPIKAPAAGISIGLATNGSNELLIDLTGTEDHYGQMDFKIAGTKDEVTAFQLDVKQPLSLTVVADALEFARQGRIEILKEMSVQSEKTSEGAVSGLRPRADLKSTAPRVEIVRFDPVRKRDLLGPGGVVIRQMEDRFNVSLDLTQEGQCLLFGDDVAMVKKARAAVMDLVSDVEVGLNYEGTVVELRDFGAIIELLRNKEGLCHVSELATREEIRNHPSGSLGLVNELLHEGQKIDVVCTAVDVIQGTIRVRPASKIKKK